MKMWLPSLSVEETRNLSTFITDVEAIINAKNIIDKINRV